MTLYDEHMLPHPDFECYGGTLQDFDDGHIPETFSEPSKWIQYPEQQQQQPPPTTPQVWVYDQVCSPSIVDALYHVTVDEGQPWGVYITMDQVYAYNNNNNKESDGVSTEAVPTTKEALSLHAVSKFVHQAKLNPTAIIPSSNKGTNNCASPPTLDSNSKIHGVAVWALASSGTTIQQQQQQQQQAVPYHVDYAELVRYEHNVVCTPLYAGTLQCTRSSIKGGEFAVNLRGLAHYQHHGYKGIKSGDDMGGWIRPTIELDDIHYNDNDDDDNDDEEALLSNNHWVTIPYRYNRMICHMGDLPHLSAPFVSTNDGNDDGCHRVIVGFNVFGPNVGPLVQVAPEHSHAFRRRIACQRALLLLRREENNNNNNNNKNHHANYCCSIQSLRNNKVLTKLLVLAKREKVKLDFCTKQRQLDLKLHSLLRLRGPKGTTVETLMNQLLLATIINNNNNNDDESSSSWPWNVIDVQIHIQRRVKDGTLWSNDTTLTPTSVVGLVCKDFS